MATLKVIALSALLAVANAFGGGPHYVQLPNRKAVTDGGVCAAAVGETSKMEDRIVNGVAAAAHEFPFYVPFAPTSGELCGASLIAPQWALTAQHCTTGTKASKMSVYVNATTYYWGSTDGTKYTIKTKFEHTGFSMSTLDNDLTLLKLTTPVTGITKFATYATAAQYSNTNQCVTTIGFGTTSSNGDVSRTLNKVGLYVVDQATCVTDYKNYGAVTGNMICATDFKKKNYQDSCQGDSGGPLFAKAADGSYVQMGIVSWGNACAEANYPGIYTRVANYVDWIDQTIAANP